MKLIKLTCNQCNPLMINGIFTHETGCPNQKKTWDNESQNWIEYIKCFDCGYDIEIGTMCNCLEPVEID